MKKKMGLLLVGVIMVTSLPSFAIAGVDEVIDSGGATQEVVEQVLTEEEKEGTEEIIEEAEVEEIVNVENIDHGNEFYAGELFNLGVLKGTENGLELDGELTRIQGMVIYFRLLGARDAELESKAQGLGDLNITPFTDVPAWAIKEVNYLFNEGLVNGISETEIGSNNIMSSQEFTTLILRAIGYNDQAGDFAWNESIDMAVNTNLILQERAEGLKASNGLSRGDMSYIAYNGMEVMRVKHEADSEPIEDNVETEAEVEEVEIEVEIETEDIKMEEEGITEIAKIVTD